MDQNEPKGRDWNEAITEASEHVEARGAAVEEAKEKQRPRDSGPVLAAATLILVLSLAWVGFRFQAPPEAVPINETVNLAWFVVDAVELVEDFRAEAGRLPEPGEVATMFEEGTVYSAAGDGYTVTIDDGDRSIEYSSETPLNEWVAIYATSSMEEEG